MKIQIIQKDMERRDVDKILDSLLKDGNFREMFLSRIEEMIKTK